ncbi:hypothetical protein MKY34_14025 [Sporosarcina sp. FSL K6-1522]|uniref:hypothetical protein n=1 Tax=Sporosarcina sp. FSL K6-1522 TaxID=2921554 RepID=UPI00315A2771
MRIQSINATIGYVKPLHNEEAKEQNLSHLLLDKEDIKNNKARFEIRNEGGYIRKYVVKANGDKILIMETKQTKAQAGMQSNETGDLIDITHDMLMKQLEKSSNPLQQEKRTMAAWEKDSGISKYKMGI